MVVRIYQISRLPVISKATLFEIFFKPFYDSELHKPKWINLMHLTIRSVLFFALSYLIILASYYAHLAQINFGVISSMLTLSTPLNALISYLVFKERMTIKMIVGTTIIIGGIVWISLAKGHASDYSMDPSLALPSPDNDYHLHRFLAITLTISCGFINSLRVFHSKFTYSRTMYDPMDLSIDAGLFCAVALFGVYVGCWVVRNEQEN